MMVVFAENSRYLHWNYDTLAKNILPRIYKNEKVLCCIKMHIKILCSTSRKKKLKRMPKIK